MEPHMKMWGFETKGARKFTRTSPRTLPWNFKYFLRPRKKWPSKFSTEGEAKQRPGGGGAGPGRKWRHGYTGPVGPGSWCSLASIRGTQTHL